MPKTEPHPEMLALARKIANELVPLSHETVVADTARSFAYDAALAALIQGAELASKHLADLAEKDMIASHNCRSGNAGERLRSFAQRRLDDASSLSNFDHMKGSAE